MSRKERRVYQEKTNELMQDYEDKFKLYNDYHGNNNNLKKPSLPIRI